MDMPNEINLKGIRIMQALIVFFVFVLISHAQSSALENMTVPYPIQDYLSWSISNEIPWTIDFEEGYNDKSSLKSGPIECSGISSLRMNVFGPTIIKFKWKIDAPSVIGELIFKVDSNKTFECHSRDWAVFNYPLSEGKIYELEWNFIKIKSYPLWKGSGWIDDIEVIQLGRPEKKEPGHYNGETLSNNDSSSLDKVFPSNKTVGYDYITNKDYILGPNITVIIENISYPLENGACPAEAGIAVEPIAPKQKELLSLNDLTKFSFIPKNCDMVRSCELFLDGNRIDYSRNIKNGVNSINLKNKLDSEGVYHWSVKCCECGSQCNSSEEIYFTLARENNTTYVNQTNPDESRFVYATLSKAINRTIPGGKIIVNHGNYYENIRLNKSLNILGINMPNIYSNNSAETIKIERGDVDISGLSIIGDGVGFFMDAMNTELANISLKNNLVISNSSAIISKNSKNIILYNNTIKCLLNNSRWIFSGIEFYNNENSTIMNNTIDMGNWSNGCRKYCIYLDNTKTSTIFNIRNNTFINYNRMQEKPEFCIESIGISQQSSIENFLLNYNFNKTNSILNKSNEHISWELQKC